MPAAPSRVLVLAPHPDDETFGCGGTIRLLTSQSTPVDVLFLTRGELGVAAPGAASDQEQHVLAAVRTREAQQACLRLGVTEVRFLPGRDCQLAEQLELAEPLAKRLVEGEYQRVFCPWRDEAHPDHAATFRLLQRALRRIPAAPSIWLYEVWTPLRPTSFVPIESTLPDKLAAIELYASQLACLDYLAAFRGLASYRALFCPPARFAEAFQVLDRDELLAIP